LSGRRHEAIWIIGGALLLAAVILVWALLSREQHLIPYVYPMF